jgi:hypothetical protein
MDEDTEYLLGVIRNSKNPGLDDILNTLKVSGKMPTMSVGYPEGGANADYNLGTDHVRLHPSRGGNTGSVGHELTHALDMRLFRRASDIESRHESFATPEDLQYQAAFRKLQKPAPLPTNLPNKSEFDRRWQQYRMDPTEARAFGVGNHLLQGTGNDAIPHMDASQATEADILRDLYRRSMTSVKKPPEQSGWIDTLLNLLRR